jgi:hypothetical protein
MRRLLFVVVTVLVAGSVCRADDAEDKAVKFVEKLGGTVTRDEKSLGKPVVVVNLRFTRVKDVDLKELTGVPHEKWTRG